MKALIRVLARLVPVSVLCFGVAEYSHAAGAISSITNSMSASKTCVNIGTTIDFQTKADYGQLGGVITNAYTSNYMVNLGHTSSPGGPVNFSWNTSNVNWQFIFMDTDAGGEPSWRLQDGTFLIFTGTRYWNGETGGWDASQPVNGVGNTGQYDPTFNSTGPSAHVGYVTGGSTCP